MTFWDYFDKVIDADTVSAVVLLIIGAIITLVFQHCYEAWIRRGKLKVYYSNYYDTTFRKPACFTESWSKSHVKYISCILPVQLDFVNTSGRKHVFRAVTAIALKDGKKVATFNPITRGKDTQDESGEYKYYGTPTTSYSFTIAENECLHTDLLFLHETPAQTTNANIFDEIQLQWNDKKDKPHKKTILRITHCWKPGELPLSQDWIRLC